MKEVSRQIALVVTNFLQLMFLLLVATYALAWAASQFTGWAFVLTAGAIIALAVLVWLRVIRPYFMPQFIHAENARHDPRI